ncbi:hypothetical protein KSS87_014955 [Heliosperma pusillum]|nr:hypothetical protein KSS87_014955 [Heliosperma pusillum]
MANPNSSLPTISTPSISQLTLIPHLIQVRHGKSSTFNEARKKYSRGCQERCY